ncbi:MAG: Asp-tRNA(Asn)/Glu-tRNA(Gln) amidotransferase subunit GatA [Deltaproteobacteria bacterium]|nr:Asp-tRNA(Asn)/Glu-tRNA(Gln) amidotransferase subunit GatA [Deltaproteobacteria bacterium]
MSDPTTVGAAELRERIARRELSSVEATRAYLDRIARRDGRLHAFLHVDEEGALARAAAIDAALARGEAPGPLAGVPVALKDIFVTRGIPTTCGSRILAGWVPPYDGTAATRLRAAGAVLLGKLNMDEFAMGSSNENSAFGPTRNPWDLQRVPGGSSGGSAAAVAASLCALALGTDTGGSIRQPASLCGVVGIKPTYGRVSRYGVIAFASSLDQVGPLGRGVADCALALEVIAGHDPRDATSLPAPVPRYRDAAGRGVRGLRVGVPTEYFGAGLDPEVAAAVTAAIESLRAAGAAVVSVSLPHTEYAIAAYYLICTAEASSNLARYDGVRYGLRVERPTLQGTYRATRAAGFGPEVKRRIMLGTYALRAGYYDEYYRKAQCVRTLVREDFRRAFERCDLLATPTSPLPAFRLGEKVADPLAMYLCDAYTTSCNLAGLPGMSLPCGFTAAGLPVGLQLLGRPLEEETIFRAAFAYEAAAPGSARRPPDPDALTGAAGAAGTAGAAPAATAAEPT